MAPDSGRTTPAILELQDLPEYCEHWSERMISSPAGLVFIQYVSVLGVYAINTSDLRVDTVIFCYYYSRPASTENYARIQ